MSKNTFWPAHIAFTAFQDGILDENVNLLTTYAKASYIAEKEVLPLADKNFTVTVLRQATVYGFSY